METIEVKEITIDLSKHDTRSGSTTLARILYALFKENGIDVEYQISSGLDITGKFNTAYFKQTYINNPIENVGESLPKLLQYYKDKKIQITIIPE